MKLIVRQIAVKAARPLFFLAIISLFVIGGRAMTADAAPSDLVWEDVTGAKIQVVENSGTPWKDWYMPFCQPTSALVIHVGSQSGEIREVCYVDSGHVQLGVYQQDGEAHYAMRYDGDNTFHQTPGIDPSWLRGTLLSDDTLIAAFGAAITISNVQSTIEEVSPDWPLYIFPLPKENELTDSNGQRVWASNVAVSKNEHFAVMQMPDFGLVRIDLRTREVKFIFESSYDRNENDLLAISNDGSSAAITGNDSTKHRIYTDIDECGISTFNEVTWERTTCHFIDFADKITPLLEGSTLYNPEFSDDGRNFTVHAWDKVKQEPQEVVLTPDPESPRLDYLALGDSYTSGEGDIGRTANGKKYYLPGTDTGDDDCHISSRSYPFLLRDEWGMASDRMKSVACSGAQVLPDMYGNPTNYPGQENRLRNKVDINIARQQALANFTPGQIQQIEFVKKYQPKLVTLTGGGNDVGFAGILRYCATPAFENFVPFINSDCKYAIKGTELEKSLYDTIDTQFNFTKELIHRMQAASPLTKIVLIGYPSFLTSAVSPLCVGNSGFLTGPEAKMINTMVDYMNGMLQRAAYDMQITYVDITHALNGGRICEGSEYMTGVWENIAGNAVENERFHPNSQGHLRMANAIMQANINATDTIDPPNAGTYIPPENRPKQPKKTIKSNMVQNGVAVKILDFTIRIPPETFQAFSQFTGIVFSTPTNLGQFTAAADGSAEITVPIDNIEIGHHVLVIEGSDPQGEPIRLFQFIEIRASETDADGDGIPDDQDPCQYITAMYDEATGENICASHLTLALGGYGTKNKLASTSKAMSFDDSQDFNLTDNFSVMSESVEHATITNMPATKNGQSTSMNIIMISTALSMILVCIMGRAIYAYRKSSQR